MLHAALSQGPEATVEFAHGYTYSGHPLACAAAIATLDVYQEEGIFEKVAKIAGTRAAAIHDIGVPAALSGSSGIWAYWVPWKSRRRLMLQVNSREPWRPTVSTTGVFVRTLGDNLILSPPPYHQRLRSARLPITIKKGVRAL